MQHGFCTSPLFLQTLGHWFPNEIQNLLSSEKRTYDHWATVQLFFSLAQVRCFWRCFCFRHLSVVTLDALTPASVHSLWSSPKCLNRLCLTMFSSLQSSLLLVHLFLSNFFLPVNFAFNMLWYSTLWRATPFSNDLLWLTLFVEGVNDCLLDHCQVSSLPHYCGFKEQEITGIYTAGMVIYWNSNINIIIFWVLDFWLSWAVSSNHQNKLLKCFTLHVMYLKYMKVSLFEISYKEKWTWKMNTIF